ATEGKHLGRDVGRHYLSARPDCFSRRQRWLPVPGGDVEYAVAFLDPGELDQAPADRPRRAVDVLAPPLPTGRRGVPLRALLAAPEAGDHLAEVLVAPGVREQLEPQPEQRCPAAALLLNRRKLLAHLAQSHPARAVRVAVCHFQVA